MRQLLRNPVSQVALDSLGATEILPEVGQVVGFSRLIVVIDRVAGAVAAVAIPLIIDPTSAVAFLTDQDRLLSFECG